MPYILARRVRTSQPQTIEKTKPSFTVGSLLLPASFLREPQSGALFTNVNGVFLSPSAGGLGYHCDKSAQRYLIGMPLPVIGSAYSFVAVVNSTGTDTNYSEIFQSIKQSNGTGLLQLRHTASNWDFYHCSTSSWQLVQGVGKYKQGVPQVLVGTWDGDNIKLWIDGEYIGSVAASGWLGSEAPSSLSIGVDISAWSPIGGTYWDGDINLFAFSSGPIWPDAVAKSISGNPWQIFDDEEEYIWVPEEGGGVSDIAASGTVQSTGTASPAVAVAMSGVGASLSSGTAADRVTVNIGAAGLATAAATAGISAQVLLAGAAAALASGNATLAATLNALAAGAAQSSGTASINSGVAGALSATGADVVSGSAPIRVTVSLGASGSDTVGGSASIVGSPISPLSGAGVDVVSGSGAAVINVSLSAAGFVQAMAAGQLSMQVRLSSTGASVVSGVAGITSLGVTVDAPNGYGPQIIRPKTRRPANLGGIIF